MTEQETVDATLVARNSIHGDFTANAEYSQMLKAAFFNSPNWHKMSHVQHEALDLIALKLSRILTGNFMHADHWHDIAGYAVLAEQSCSEEER